MRKMKLTKTAIDSLKSFLYCAGKRIFDTGKRIYYVDYNGNGCRIKYA